MSVVHLDTDADPVSARLEGDLTFSTVSELRPALEDALHKSAEQGRGLAVSLDGMGSFDVAGVQLLYALKAGAEERAVAVTFDAGRNEERIKKMLSFTGLPAL
jgi:ABC-type transporter Mla MlaB component